VVHEACQRVRCSDCSCSGKSMCWPTAHAWTLIGPSSDIGIVECRDPCMFVWTTPPLFVRHAVVYSMYSLLLLVCMTCATSSLALTLTHYQSEIRWLVVLVLSLGISVVNSAIVSSLYRWLRSKQKKSNASRRAATRFVIVLPGVVSQLITNQPPNQPPNHCFAGSKR
jgi:hypothetical protein